MPVTVERIGDEPIVYARLTGVVTVEDALTVFSRTAELRQDMPDVIWRITDVQDAESTFPQMMKILKEASAASSGSTTADSTVNVVFVGKNGWSKLFIDAMRQANRGNVQIPMFEDGQLALDYVRGQIRDQRNAS